MNREQLEKMLKENFCITGSFGKIRDDIFIDDIKDFIFDNIIPEVLKSVLHEWNKQTYISTYKNYIKPKVKELYNITL